MKIDSSTTDVSSHINGAGAEHKKAVPHSQELSAAEQYCGVPTDITTEQSQVIDWHKKLRNVICAILEIIEQDIPAVNPHGIKPARFKKKSWVRQQENHESSSHHQQNQNYNDNDGGNTGGGGTGGGGGEMALLHHGRIFEKAGVNISTVHGVFPPHFSSEIRGAKENRGAYWASGLSLVIHPRNPHVPAIHMNTRMIRTSQTWFGGGIDLNPALKSFPSALTNQFHHHLKQVCDRYSPLAYPHYSAECRRYFTISHRNQERGVGGIFFDHLQNDTAIDLGFIQDIGRAFTLIYPLLVSQTVKRSWSNEDRAQQLQWRGRYAEFNLVYDRGTRFGLKTNGNPEAVLMSLPPLASWV